MSDLYFIPVFGLDEDMSLVTEDFKTYNRVSCLKLNAGYLLQNVCRVNKTKELIKSGFSKLIECGATSGYCYKVGG